jgi:hypothetical protein
MEIGRGYLVCGAVALGVALLLAGPARAHDGEPGGHLGNGILSFADPTPDLGIGYEWTVHLLKKEKADLVWYVGAKSWNEPSNPEGLKGWTHTSNWVAIELEEAASLVVTVERQSGVVYISNGLPFLARGSLYPAVSLYSGWDDTTEFEDHVFNNAGNFWSTIQFLGNLPNTARKGKAKTKITFRTKKLAAGRYSLVIGGNPPPLTTYPASNCDPVDPTCWDYTGPHGYRARIEAR